MILASFDAGLSFRDVAERHGLAVPLVRAIWEAWHIGGRSPACVLACAACSGRGVKDGEPCARCRATGLSGGG